MKFETYAKAWAALAVAVLTALVHLTLPPGIIPIGISAIEPLLIVIAVVLVPNRMEGWNVADLARALLDANTELEREGIDP